MEKVFKQNIKQLQLINDHKLLLAISGGVDSMVLLDLCLKNKLKVNIAHCNFQLRGEASNKDEEFLLDFAKQYNVNIHTKKFNVKEYKRTGNYSTQIAARNLRYSWFEELMSQNNYDFLLTAHHLDDSLETFIINLSRGTGISGLTGIPINSNAIKRPLHNITKKEIVLYAKAHNLLWREDESNKSDDYLRNKIRHHISPLLEDLHPKFHQNFFKTINLLKDNEKVLALYYNEVGNKLFNKDDDKITILIDDLLTLTPLETHLFHLFSKYGFNQPTELIKLIQAKTGAEIKSEQYRLIKDRVRLLLAKIENTNPKQETIFIGEKFTGQKTIELVESTKKDSKAKEVIDFSKLALPLHIRVPRIGDEFMPLNMQGTKKLSKYFKDLKLSKLEKESVKLLCDANDQIIWVVGYRLDDRFKINENTTQFLNIYYVE